MKGYTLNQDRWHYAFYKATFDHEPNQNFCDYFWALLEQS